jgi:hypothetical protein
MNKRYVFISLGSRGLCHCVKNNGDHADGMNLTSFDPTDRHNRWSRLRMIGGVGRGGSGNEAEGFDLSDEDGSVTFNLGEENE